MKKSAAAKAAGTLYVVATPIGNYDDITLRALNALQECDMIICEESKEALRLLKHYDIEKEVIELNEHNDTESSVECMKLLTQGKKLALISDAGTPLLADPGDILVKTAVKYKIDVRVLPGASSVLTALVRSTHSSKQFVYAGFLSRKNEERDAEIQLLSHEARTIVLMDTPYRLKTILSALAAAMPDRQAYVGCNLTMTNEAHHYGTLTELEEYFEANKFRGEYVIVIEGSSEPFPVVHAALHAAQQQAVAQVPADKAPAEQRATAQEPAGRGRGRRAVQPTSNEDPLEGDVVAIPLPDPENDYANEVSVDDYEPVVPAKTNGEGSNYGPQGDGQSREGQRDRDWNNGGRRWNNNHNNNHKRRWDNNRRPQGGPNDRREGYSRQEGEGGQNYRGGSQGPNGNRQNQYGPRDNNRRNNNANNNYRQGNRPQYRNAYRDQRDGGANPNYRDPQREQPINDQQPPLINTPNPTNQNTYYDESYDRRENFGNREGANYSRFDQSQNRDSYGNRGGFNRGGRGNSRGNFNRGNAAPIDGNRRSDNPVYSHLNDLPPKRRKW